MNGCSREGDKSRQLNRRKVVGYSRQVEMKILYIYIGKRCSRLEYLLTFSLLPLPIFPYSFLALPLSSSSGVFLEGGRQSLCEIVSLECKGRASEKIEKNDSVDGARDTFGMKDGSSLSAPQQIASSSPSP